MKVGHLCLARKTPRSAARFIALVEALDRLAVRQYVLVADAAVARRLQGCPYVEVGPIVRSPVVANCLVPAIDIVHAHDERGAQAGLLLTLTRSIPYVLTAGLTRASRGGSLHRSVLSRARAQVPPDLLDADALIETYQRAAGAGSEFPENADSG